MTHRISTLAIAATTLCAAFTSCTDNDTPPIIEPVAVSSGVFVANQGDYYNNITGNLTYFDFATELATQNAFSAANNGTMLGDTPQDIIVYGGKVYIAVYASNLIRVIDRATLKLIKDVRPDASTGTQPRSMAAAGGNVYITMFDGYVARLDTTSLAFNGSVAVGPNPEGIAALKGKLYVANSDGLNYENGYVNGKSVSVVNASTMTVEKTIAVGLNPGKVVATSSDIFLISKGNYADIPSTLQRIDAAGNVSEIAPATLVCSCFDTVFYIDYPIFSSSITYTAYNAATGVSTPMSFSGVKAPAAIAADPVSGLILITSYNMNNGYADYMSPGYASLFKSDGTLVATFATSLNPCAIAFNSDAVK